MADIPKSLRVLRGKYRITDNVYVGCRLDILEANASEMQLFLGVKRRGDNLVPVGTRILLDTAPINKRKVFHNDPDTVQTVVRFLIKVLEVRDLDGKPLLVCSPIQKETVEDRRTKERIPIDFPVLLANGRAQFTAINGTPQGLTLRYAAKKALVSLLVDHSYDFILNHKDMDYVFSGVIKHIHYDWRHYEHLIGVHFPQLSKEQEVVLNLLIDPEYTIQISAKQTVNTSLGKISDND